MKMMILAILVIASSITFAQKSKPFLGKQEGFITFEKTVFKVDSFAVNTVRLSKESQQLIINYKKNKNLQKFGYSLNQLETNLKDAHKKVVRKEKNPFNSFFDKYMNDLEVMILLPEYEIYKAELVQYKRIYEYQKRQKVIEDSLTIANANNAKMETTYLDEKKSREALMRQWSRNNAGHDYLTVFYGFELNFAKTMLSFFIDKNLNMSESEDNFNGDNETLYYSTTGGGKPENLMVKYFFTGNEHGYYIIDSVSITGDFNPLASLFIQYWPTKMNLNDVKKGEWAYYYLMYDRIGFLVDRQANAKIIVKKSPYSPKSN